MLTDINLQKFKISKEPYVNKFLDINKFDTNI